MSVNYGMKEDSFMPPSHTQSSKPSTTVLLADLRAQHRGLGPELQAAIDRVFASSEFVLGEEVRRFEAEFAAYCGTAEAVACANGTDALELALWGIGVGPGDEVITVANTFAATAEAIVRGRAGKKDEHAVVGRNSRMDGLQGAILRVKLRHLGAWNERRREIAARYRHLLAEADVFPVKVPVDSEPVYHQFVIRTAERDAL